MKYNLWTVIDENKIHRDNKVYLLCKCECGTEKEVIIKNLKSGVSKSCGCLNIKRLKERATHGKRHTRVWRIWQAMKNRCYNPNVKQYKNYGGRGIKVCDEWKDNFVAFYDYMGDCPEGFSIDRIDVNGNYEPGNVRWSSPMRQMSNKTNNRKINEVCITYISKELGGSHSLVAKRLKRGWSIEKATTTKSNASI